MGECSDPRVESPIRFWSGLNRLLKFNAFKANTLWGEKGIINLVKLTRWNVPTNYTIHITVVFVFEFLNFRHGYSLFRSYEKSFSAESYHDNSPLIALNRVDLWFQKLFKSTICISISIQRKMKTIRYVIIVHLKNCTQTLIVFGP